MKKRIAMLLALLLCALFMAGCTKAPQEAPVLGAENVNSANGGWLLAKGKEYYVGGVMSEAVCVRNGKPVKLGFSGYYLNDLGDRVLFVESESLCLGTYDVNTGKVTQSTVAANCCTAIDGYIYFSDTTGTFRMPADNWTSFERLADVTCNSIQYQDGRVYGMSQAGVVWDLTCALEGGEATPAYVLANPYGLAAWTDDGLYFTVPGAAEGVQKMVNVPENPKYHSESQQVAPSAASRFALCEDGATLYFVDESETDGVLYALYSQKADDPSTRTRVADDVNLVIHTAGEDVVYRDMKSGSIYRITDGEILPILEY